MPLTNKDLVSKYKSLKIEFYSWYEGFSKGNLRAMDKIRGFFRNLEDMIFNVEIDINDDCFL